MAALVRKGKIKLRVGTLNGVRVNRLLVDTECEFSHEHSQFVHRNLVNEGSVTARGSNYSSAEIGRRDATCQDDSVPSSRLRCPPRRRYPKSIKIPYTNPNKEATPN